MTCVSTQTEGDSSFERGSPHVPSEVLETIARIWRRTLYCSTPLSAAAAGAYALLGIPSMVVFGLVHLVFWAGLLAIYSRVRRGIEGFLFCSQLFLLVSSFVMVLVLGGLVESGGVALLGFIGPLYALASPNLRRAVILFVAYVVSILAAALLQPWLRPTGELTPALNLGLWTFHVLVVVSFTFTALYSFVGQRNTAVQLLHAEQQRSENLLLNILPKEIAAILKQGERVIADDYDGASILFADLVGFTPMSARMKPEDIVGLLNEVFTHFDSLVETYGLEKIKTVGDCYMVAAGVPCRRPDHACAIAGLALDMLEFVRSRTFQSGRRIDFRIGINSGRVVAGVIGRKKFVYDLWGDAVNTAHRMETHGAAGTIQITRATYEQIKDDFVCAPVGTIPIKGKGDMEVWRVEGRQA